MIKCVRCETYKDISEFYEHNHSWCKMCMAANSSDRQQARRKQASTIMGSVCKRCGETDARTFVLHHIDPALKSFNIVFSMSWDKLIPELCKCELLCANCHAIEHST